MHASNTFPFNRPFPSITKLWVYRPFWKINLTVCTSTCISFDCRLPVPWLLYSIVNGGASVQVVSSGLFCSVILLAGMLLVTVLSIATFRWKLGKILGGFYLFMYTVFITLSILLELVIDCSIVG